FPSSVVRGIRTSLERQYQDAPSRTTFAVASGQPQQPQRDVLAHDPEPSRAPNHLASCQRRSETDLHEVDLLIGGTQQDEVRSSVGVSDWGCLQLPLALRLRRRRGGLGTLAQVAGPSSRAGDGG